MVIQVYGKDDKGGSTTTKENHDPIQHFPHRIFLLPMTLIAHI